MIVAALALALAAGDPQSVDLTVNKTEPAHCGWFDSYYFNCSLARSAEAKRQEALRKQVGQLIAAGKCDDAYKTALDAGDLDLAARARGLCQSPSTPPQ